ncbi:MAG: helix-turn-helix domain-containing protein [Candidatus Limnocylindrales bacterium]
MALSIIHQHSPSSSLAAAIGHELRRRRTAAGLSQTAVGAPFTRSFVSAIEHGRAIPSITALAVLLEHLRVDFDEFFSGVQTDMTAVYTRGHGDRQEAPSGGRR